MINLEKTNGQARTFLAVAKAERKKEAQEIARKCREVWEKNKAL